MENYANEPEIYQDQQQEDREVSGRREFLRSLGKWSTAAIAAILLSESLPVNDAAGLKNRSASWANGGGAWLKSGANWINRGGGGWLNSRGGGGSWVNRRGW
ncbi:MAG TPA: hypothetical protein VFS77_22810 [Pyrinomonadaceae bacterium]|nr:hypothetical protein [Pyrinomonadaceae bacterium]